MASPQGLILLVGMHRSGTSLEASLHERLGVSVPGPWPRADGHNLEGYDEQLTIRDLQEQLLSDLNRNWASAARNRTLDRHLAANQTTPLMPPDTQGPLSRGRQSEPALVLETLPAHCCLLPQGVRFRAAREAVRLTLHLQPLAVSRAQGRLGDLRTQATVLAPSVNQVEMLRQERVNALLQAPCIAPSPPTTTLWQWPEPELKRLHDNVPATTAPWCQVLDADHELEPDALELTLSMARSSPSSTAGVQPLWELRGEAGLAGHDSGRALLERTCWQAGALVDGNKMGALPVLRRESWQKVGGYSNLAGWKDSALWRRFLETVLNGVPCPQRRANHHRHLTSKQATRSKDSRSRIRQLMQQRHQRLQLLPQPT